MAGETSLRTLLRTLTPELNPGDYVFCTCADMSITLSRFGLFRLRFSDL
ncbi:ACT domain-containing protein, partial [Pseudomonas aeruginosa]